MKRTVCKDDFVQAFRDYNREINFSREGLEALFDYLERLEEDTGKETELDVIALCCDFSEYETFAEIQNNYNVKDLKELEGKTQVIRLDSGGLIIWRY